MTAQLQSYMVMDGQQKLAVIMIMIVATTLMLSALKDTSIVYSASNAIDGNFLAHRGWRKRIAYIG
jgi:hypothetical protein